MNIILFQPRGYELTKGIHHIGSLACVMPPLGLASIAAVLRKNGHTVTLLDAALFASTPNELWAEEMYQIKPDMVGFTATTSSFHDAYDVCTKVKNLMPECTTVFGGVHVSWGKGEILKKFDAIDLIIAGEGELAMLELARGTLPSQIETVYYRDNYTIKNGTTPLPLIEMDDLPFPAYDLLQGFPKKYLMPLFGYPKHPGANIISSRGCVYQCTYCDRSVFGKSFRWNSPEYTFEQIQWLHKTFGIRHVNFYDDLFTLNRKRVADLCNRLASAKNKVTFNCIVRIGHIDQDLIALLKKAGCWMVSVGIESGDQSILDSHKDGLSIEKIKKDINFLHKSGLWVKGLFMIGFPGETESSIIKTRELACSLPIKDANLTAFTPFPGAPISKEIDALGRVDHDWSHMDCVNFTFISNEINDVAILKKHYEQFYREFYNRPFMRYHVYPRMMIQSPHSFYRLIRHAGTFLKFFDDKK
jgi:radical SAM superfamily enzyme YgiQ (UPF0313 family)